MFSYRSPARRIASIIAVLAIALMAVWPPIPALAKGTSLPPDVKLVQAGDITVGYRELGEGTPIVLITGFSAVMDLWDPTFVDALAQQHRVIMFDNRGMGYTSATREPFSIPQFADDTAALMTALGIEHADILGWSMGTYISQELALRHPEMVDRLILYAGDCGGDEAIQPDPSVLAALADTSGTDEERGLRLLGLLFPPTWIEANVAYIQQVFSRPMAPSPVESIARQVDAMAVWDGTCDRLGEISQPTLVVTGLADVITPPENSQMLAERIPSAELVEFPYGGHGLMYQQPAQFADLVLEFLASPIER